MLDSGTPKGICGSELLALLAILLELWIVDESGYLLPPDEVYFKAADMRQPQLSKVAEVLVFQFWFRRPN